MSELPSPMPATPEVTVTVRLFASLRERAGWTERCVPLGGAGALLTPAGLWRQLDLGEVSPEGEPPVPVRVAVNRAFASLHQPLRPGDEVAFLPPISGG